MHELFRRFDVNGSSTLEPKELSLLFRTAMPSLTPQQLRYLLAHVNQVHGICAYVGGGAVAEIVAEEVAELLAVRSSTIILREQHRLGCDYYG